MTDIAEESSFVSAAHGETIHTYKWTPSSSTAPRGVIFLIHGLHSCTTHEFLAPSDNEEANHMPPSVHHSAVETFLNVNLIVMAHDHRGHGKSDGMRAFFNVTDLVDDTIQFIDEECEKLGGSLPIFLCGVSMGGTISIITGRKKPENFRGVVVVSPAVKEPDDSFGLLGKFLKALSPVVASLMSTSEVLRLPRPPVEKLRRYWDADPEVWHGKLRALPGHTMVGAYRDIDAHRDEVTFPVAILIGTEDSLVSPTGMKDFYEAIPSKDKDLKVFDGMWHCLFLENGADKVLSYAKDWVEERL